MPCPAAVTIAILLAGRPDIVRSFVPSARQELAPVHVERGARHGAGVVGHQE